MAKTQEFKLSDNLEALIRNAQANNGILEESKTQLSNPDFREKIASEEVYNDERLLTIDDVMVRKFVRTKRAQAYDTLNTSIEDETLKEAKVFYMPQLAEAKPLYYAEMIKSPDVKIENPSKELAGIITGIRLLDQVKKLTSAGNLDTAEGLVKDYVDTVEKVDLQIDRLYTGTAFAGNRKKVIERIAEIQYAKARHSLEEKGETLYAEIDQAVDSSKYGKAVSMMTMIGAYNAQQDINKQKAEEAAKEKKK
ncbi:hypothetical protein J4476_03365 [Candidatus Woesearchaeota archaeon]|nr:MAG: hypothetical protein QT09_C0006G0017 [archaeon GW2011_AR18]MBS3161707.1 hypothetical protein [Candidatus Woesearchaeota archaeon]HIH25718.1 hypothetical protein [Nanoarchaeota archaeon]